MKKSVKLKVDTPKGKATLVDVYVTELGHLMAKVYHPTSKNWINYRIGDVGELVRNGDMEREIQTMG